MKCKICKTAPCVCRQLRAELTAMIRLHEASGLSVKESMEIVDKLRVVGAPIWGPE